MKYLILLLCTIVACTFNNSTIQDYDFSGDNSKKLYLPDELKEISGLALSPKGDLFAHNDEYGAVFQIDPDDGKIIRSFTAGSKKIYDDFEGIAITPNYFYLTNSGGVIYKFNEKDNRSIEFYKIQTKLTKRYDVEGLCYDAETKTVLLACKGYPGDNYKGYKAIYSFDLKSSSLLDEPRFLINLKSLEKYKIKRFEPSSIEKDPVTRSFFVLSANEPALVQLSSEGKILNAVKLSKELHKQPEGITFLKDGTLLISDESTKTATITKYFNK